MHNVIIKDLLKMKFLKGDLNNIILIVNFVLIAFRSAKVLICC